MTNINDNNDNWNDEIDDELPSWLSAWESGSVFGGQSSFLDDIDEREDIFGKYASFIDKGDTTYYRYRDNTGKRYSNPVVSNIDLLFDDLDSELNFSDTKNTSYSLGRVADQTNGVDLRYNLLLRIAQKYEKYVAFALGMRMIPLWTDSLRLSRMAQKDNFDNTILPITKEKYARLFNEMSIKDCVVPYRVLGIDGDGEDRIRIIYPTIFNGFVSTLHNHRQGEDWYTGLDASLLPVFMASLNVILSQLGDSYKLVDKEIINAIQNCDSHLIHASSKKKLFGKYIQSNDIPSTNRFLKHTNYFLLEDDDLVELYNELTDCFNSKYKQIFDKEIHSSDNPTEHLQTCINLSIDWQKIWQNYLEKKHRDSNSPDKFSDIMKQISMNSQVGSSMTETMGRKIGNNATEMLDDVLEQTKKERVQKQSEKRKSNSRNSKGFRDSSIYNKDYDVSDHPVPLINIPLNQLIPSHSSSKVNAILDEHKRLQYGQKLGKIGDITNKAWKLNLGNTRVFRVKPRTEAKVRIVIDISGSMGGVADSESRLSSAFKIANGIQKCFQDVETYMCAVEMNRDIVPKEIANNYENYRHFYGIGKIPNYTMINDRGYGENWVRNSSTPLCLGIQEMKNSLIGSYDKSVGIIITDGYPNDSVPRLDGTDKYCDCADHSKDLCHELYNAGTRFGVININPYESSYYEDESIAPSDCSIKIAEVDKDIKKVGDLFNWLLTR